MPKRSKYPGLRRHGWTTSKGERKTAYYLEQTIDGRRKETALGTDFAEALKKWHALVFNRPLEAGTLKEAFDKFEQEALTEYANATTRRNYGQSLRKLRPVFGHMRWEDVKVPMIAEYLKRRSAKVQANREKALLSVVWGKAREWGMTELPFPAYKMRLSNQEAPQAVEVTQAAFDAVYKHAPQHLKDAMDIASATGMRVRDVLGLRLSDVRDGRLVFQASKTGKRGDFDLSESPTLTALIERRRAMKSPHVFLLACGNRIVTERMLTDGWARARAQALPDCPEVEGLLLRHMRRFAAQQAGSLQEAQQLLQHGSAATTARHYRPGEKLRPVR